MASGASHRLSHWLNQIWHLPDNLRWMDPLPPLHRRGIFIALLVMLIGFLWPSSTPQYPVERPQPVSVPEEAPIQAEIYNNPSQPPADAADEGSWRSYTIASGQTLAQLFRDNNLPVNDVFAMARVEGNDKPLSSLQSGQQVRIRQNAQGTVTGLTVESANGQVLFTRQADGTFIRAQ